MTKAPCKFHLLQGACSSPVVYRAPLFLPCSLQDYRLRCLCPGRNAALPQRAAASCLAQPRVGCGHDASGTRTPSSLTSGDMNATPIFRLSPATSVPRISSAQGALRLHRHPSPGWQDGCLHPLPKPNPNRVTDGANFPIESGPAPITVITLAQPHAPFVPRSCLMQRSKTRIPPADQYRPAV